MARVTYLPNHSDETLDIDPITNQAMVTTHGPQKGEWLLGGVIVGWAIVSVLVIIVLGIGFMDLAFGTT